MADIGPPVRLLIILNDHNSVRLELRNGIPNSMEELIEEVKNSCGLEGYIRLQYKDTDFGNTFVNLTSTHAIKDLTVIKVVELDPESTTVVLYPVEIPLNEIPESMEQETISLLAEQQKRNNRQSIKEKMAKAFGYRRQEIVHQRPSIEGLLERWPALFHMEETVDIAIRRECILESLMIYLGEPVDHLIKEFQVAANLGKPLRLMPVELHSVVLIHFPLFFA
ncbi:hypothetical protein JOQ06_011060 [Pogonophryne albipinna]|uniref:Uncharacterized protein n=1 Tax=Pogonophryne albipinna TaxID=1090488 RepID=A0AAD6AX71_9TELE|nr:hypothetical protein JOQ06_011060 [Pogonophryne albipinna]